MQRVAALVAAAVVAAACGSSGLLRQYEYEEDIHISLNGTATVYVNASIAAIDRLRGAKLASEGTTRIDTERVRAFFSTPVSHVIRVSRSRRNGRPFVHVRVEVDDIRHLAEAAPFAWSTYSFEREGDLYVYKQIVGRPSEKDVTSAAGAGWSGRELVAFRLHVPSKIAFHNTLPGNLLRGNILVWEQSFEERRRGKPLILEARMQMESILNRTLWLFGITLAGVVLLFGLVIWWLLRHRSEIT
jgi:hypothetical protein